MKESKIPKFRRCVIQNFPFIEEDFDALTDYALLCKVVEYLNKVIDSQNDVVAKTDGLIESFAQLKSYVDNYFDNLDVQEEINNKLEDMAEGGELAGIIAQFLELAPVFGYDTISDMASATNLSNGCIARVLGNTSATAGDGAYYKIKTRVESDDPDGVNLVAIGETLVGVRIQDAAINDLQNTINRLTTNEFIIMGDSYAVGDTSWASRLITKIGNKATCHKIVLGGLGFAHQSSIGNYTFKTYLQSQAATITNPQNINKIIVCGGYNDNTETFENITTAIASFCEYCKTTYPNAQVYIGMIGYNTAKTGEGAYVRARLEKITLNAYSYNYNVDYAPVFIKGSNEILKNENFTGSDSIHPNTDGSSALAKALYAWYLGGEIDVKTNIDEVTFDNTSYGTVQYQRLNNCVHVYTTTPLIFTFDTAITVNSGVGDSGFTEIDNYTATKLFPNLENEMLIPVQVSIISNDTTYRNLQMYFGLKYNGKAILYSSIYEGSDYKTFTNVTYIRIECPFSINLDSQIN